MSHLDLELDIQRCIDGQMSEADQQALLRRLEALPDGWRQLSLAFVESQVWSQVIQKSEVAVSKSLAPKPRPVRQTPFGLWGKVAASMAAGIMAGLVIHRQWSGAPPVGAGPALVAATSSGGEGRTKTASPDSIQGAVSANNAASLASNRPGFPEILSSHARRQLQESGYPVDERQVYYSILMPDGRHYVVPMNTLQAQNAAQ